MQKIGTCPKCQKEPRILPYRHPKTREPICPNCYSKIKREEKKAANPNGRKTYKKNPYPTKESVIAALKKRTEAGKSNSATILHLQDGALYKQAFHFNVPLPKRSLEKKAFRISSDPTAIYWIIRNKRGDSYLSDGNSSICVFLEKKLAKQCGRDFAESVLINLTWKDLIDKFGRIFSKVWINPKSIDSFRVSFR